MGYGGDTPLSLSPPVDGIDNDSEDDQGEEHKKPDDNSIDRCKKSLDAGIDH